MSKGKSNSFKFGLRKNGQHSLWRGIESYESFRQSQDSDMWLLKEAVMFLHQGTELLMKEILRQHSEYLIFADLGQSTVKKQKQAIQQKIGIFFLPKPPRTVNYSDAINRVEAFINPAELDETLIMKLEELNQYRNQLEHYAIDADAEKVVQMIADLHEPLLNLFEAQLGDIKQNEPANVSRMIEEVQNEVKQYHRTEQEVHSVVQHFSGQRIPGILLNSSDKEVILPNFAEGKVTMDFRAPEIDGSGVDVFGETDQTRWVIEVKSHLNRRTLLWALSQVSVNSQLLDAKAWLIVFSDIPDDYKSKANDKNVLITGSKEWQQLKDIVLAQ